MTKKVSSNKIVASASVQEFQTIAIVFLSVAIIVLVAIVAVLFAQVSGHRRSIEGLYQITTNLPVDK